MPTMDFLKDFEKEISSLEDVSSSAEPPRFYFSYGNYALNRVMTGNLYNGVPQGRITAIAGPSHAGKSFVAGNLIRSAQQENAYCLVIDSENAFDDDFARNVGIDTENNYNYKSVLTIPDTARLVNSFIKGYKKEYNDDSDAPKILIVIDSLDSLFTDSDWESFHKKGELKADQGLQSKQLKGMLLKFQQSIKHTNIAMVVTKQVYRAKAEQILQGEGVWIVNDAIRYPCSQILLITRLKLKDDSKTVVGIRMKCEGFKTRFTKPFQNVVIEVPYDEGMDPLSGLLELAMALEVITKKGARYVVEGEDKSWYAKDIAEYAPKILSACEKKSTEYIDVGREEEIDSDQGKVSSRTKRILNLQGGE